MQSQLNIYNAIPILSKRNLPETPMHQINLSQTLGNVRDIVVWVFGINPLESGSQEFQHVQIPLHLFDFWISHVCRGFKEKRTGDHNYFLCRHDGSDHLSQFLVDIWSLDEIRRDRWELWWCIDWYKQSHIDRVRGKVNRNEPKVLWSRAQPKRTPSQEEKGTTWRPVKCRTGDSYLEQN